MTLTRRSPTRVVVPPSYCPAVAARRPVGSSCRSLAPCAMSDLPENTVTDSKRDEQPERVTTQEQSTQPASIDPRVEEAIRRQRQAMGFG